MAGNIRERGYAWLVLLVALALPAGALGREVVVTTNDNRELRGELVSETPQAVTLMIAGIKSEVPRDSIRQVTYPLSVEEEYATRRGQIADDNVDERYKLAYWLFERKAYDLAKKELDDLAVKFPDEQRVMLLSRINAERMKKAEASTKEPGVKPAPEPGKNAAPPANPPEDPNKAGLPKERLGPKDINIIRLLEIEMSTKPDVRVPDKVVDTVFKDYKQYEIVPKGAEAQAAFRRAPGYAKLAVLFELSQFDPKVRSLYPQVQVLNDPPAMVQFKAFHGRYVINYCATVACHGGPNAGALFLFRFDPGSDTTVYTNFFILDQYKQNKFVMIDRDKPDQSLLLQYGLPIDVAIAPHPNTPNFRPYFANADDQNAAALVQWIQMLFNQPKPKYPIDYKPPQIAAPNHPKPPPPPKKELPNVPAPTPAPAAPPAAPAPAGTPK